MVATSDEEEDREGEGVQGSGAGRMRTPTLSEEPDGDSQHIWIEKEGGLSRLSQGFHPSRAAAFLKAQGHLSLSC